MRKILIGILLGLSLGISFSLFAWVNPSQNPPSGGGVLQTSNTGLTINTSTYFISGNVGIGTTGPEAKLDVRGDIILPRENIIKLGIPSVGGYGEQIRNSYGIDSNYGIAFIAGGSERMRITNTGNVGIGTTAPTGKLDVGGGQLVVTSAGNVGIGTTTPITSPGGGLHVFRSGTDAVIRVERDAGVILNIEAGTIGGAVIKTLSNHPLNLGSNSVSEILTIATSGKVGIGTTNPNEKLYVAGGNIGLDVVDGGGIKIGTQARFGVDNTNQATIRVGTGGLRILNNAQNSVLATIQDGTYSNALFINSSGNVGIGTTTPAGPLHIGTVVDAGANSPGDAASLVIGDYGTYHLELDDNEIHAMSNTGVSTLYLNNDGGNVILIGSGSGNVGIGTTNPGGYKLYVNGSLYASSYYCASDIRLKKDIQELNGTLEKIMNLHPISFVWDEKSEKAGKKDIGISGQEIEKYFPELVFKNDDGYISVDYSKLSVVAISAIKEQQKIIEEQAQKIKILEEKIKELELKIEKR